MKKTIKHISILTLAIFTAFLSGCVSQGKRYDTAPPSYWYAANPTMYPYEYASTLGADPIWVEGEFDEAAVAAQLEPGGAILQGVTYFPELRRKDLVSSLAGAKDKELIASRVNVCLYPESRLLLNWAMKRDDVFQRSRDKMLGRYYGVFMKDARGYKYKTCVTSNRYGEYKFENIKPGHYLVVAVGNVSFTETGSVRTGYVTNSYYGADVYQNVSQTVNREHTGAWAIHIEQPDAVIDANVKIETVIPYMY
ncbi:hypothetical protein [Thiosocius teredinicola]|uniref:hypothetical protein n=1 Tax=Thiosocius teredinicola TaxID=1973002 RepID=UPI000990E3B9